MTETSCKTYRRADDTLRSPFALAALLAIAPAAAAETRTLPGVEDAYKSTAFVADPMPAIDAALAAAKQSGKRVLLVMGTGGCHDSAWLANLIATDRFAPVRDRYEIVYADIGMPHVRGLGSQSRRRRNASASRSRAPRPSPMLDADGNVLNRKAAPKWRNAASRSDDDIYNELMQ